MLNDLENNRWYVIQTKPLSEERVCQQFTRVTSGSAHPEPVEGERDVSVQKELLNTVIKLCEPDPKKRDQALQKTVTRHPTPASALEVFCPKIKCVDGGKKAANGDRYKPLFPSYIFIRGDLMDPANHHMVKYTRGVNKVLGDGERPVPISDEVVEFIRSQANDGGLIEQKTFKKGDLVKVKKGYLKELIGILERPVADNGRVAVLLQLFNRQMCVQMHCSDISRA